MEAFTDNQYQQAIRQLFDRWRTSSDAFDDHFVEDGIVSPPHWASAPVRILHVLKETNDYQTSITELIHKVVTTKRKSELWWRPTFHNAGRWTHGLMHGVDGGEADYRVAHRNRRRALLHCAFINLKKTTGGRTATIAVEQAAERDAVFLREQIALIAPQIVVCGGTLGIVKQYLFPDIGKVAPRMHARDDMLFINARHPAYVEERRRMFDQVVGSYHRHRNAPASRTEAVGA
ncbi:hypothetical protein RY831_30205 [Noviherbaspirillum sp. CPCC 100848]|uniref:Uracil-DNA glycosylase-like domain-containing protein n=1 Tax=Noviherbaspirillum album TaxID=3080276 RepID=A0ABU6JK07_9BURK|nr:hypothetical protein [Noviherbaspirillum sp. CPCC 100848]MEC4723419.1 hypothetical protein [Noviherbaspirillum sp. CPCC 100848]